MLAAVMGLQAYHEEQTSCGVMANMLQGGISAVLHACTHRRHHTRKKV